MSKEILRLENVTVLIGGVYAVRNVSLNVNEGETACIVGRNGAGKTTLIKSILGLIPIASGKIVFRGRDVTKLPVPERIKLGMGYSPEDRKIFSSLTVDQNIRIASWFSTAEDKEKIVESVYSIFPELKEIKSRRGVATSGGQQKMLAIARALALQPSLLLLDEPLEGIAPALRGRLMESLNEIKKRGSSQIIAESNLFTIPKFTDKVYVMERGEIIYEGSLDEVYKNQDVMKVIRGF
jgi:branched-chain amino acid transport system ATP-binding protein